MKTPLILLIMMLCAVTYAQKGKSVPSVVGECNAVATGENITIIVSCGSGISQADAKRLAEQYRELLSQVAKGNTTSNLIMSKLSKLTRELAQVRPLAVNDVASTQYGIANAGGVVNNSPVTLNFAVPRPAPKINFSYSDDLVSMPDPYQQIKRYKGIPIDPPALVPTKVGNAFLDEDFPSAAFKVTCDQPCNVFMALPGLGAVETRPEISTDGRTTIFYIKIPEIVRKGTKVVIEAQPFSTQPGRYNLHPLATMTAESYMLH